MSELVTVSIEPQWPTTSTPGTVIVYGVSAVTRAGQGLLEVSLSSLGFPDGATVTLSPSVLRFTGHDPLIQTATLTVTCTNVTPTDNLPFTITGTAQRQTVTLTNQVQMVAQKMPNLSPSLALDSLGAGNLRLRGKGASGQTYQVESVPSLSDTNWTPVGTTTADGNGRFTFFTAVAKEAPVRFYRAVELTPAPAP
jgi:hypothetical protein